MNHENYKYKYFKIINKSLIKRIINIKYSIELIE